MRVFVTGATGFIGSAVVRELIGAGHHVTGLARSDAAAASLAQSGATVLRGELADLDTLRRGASEADGVIHTAFVHDFANFEASALTDRRAIEALTEALANSARPLVVAGGMALIAPGRIATEDDVRDSSIPFPRVSEEMAMAAAERGVRASVLRLPPTVHGEGDHGFVPALIGIAREKNASVYTGNGETRWAAVHRLDAARLFRLALENAPAGTKLHAIAEEGVPMRTIAQSIGRHLNIPVMSTPPEDAPAHFGWIARFAVLDMAGSSAKTRERFGWEPMNPTLIDDLEQGHYFATAPSFA